MRPGIVELEGSEDAAAPLPALLGLLAGRRCPDLASGVARGRLLETQLCGRQAPLALEPLAEELAVGEAEAFGDLAHLRVGLGDQVSGERCPLLVEVGLEVAAGRGAEAPLEA